MDPLGILCQGKFLPDLSSLRCCPSGECTFDDSTGTTLDETNFPFGRVLLLLPQRLRLGSNRLYIDVYTPEVLFGGGFLPVSKAATVVFFWGGSFTIRRNVCRKTTYTSQFCRILLSKTTQLSEEKNSPFGFFLWSGWWIWVFASAIANAIIRPPKLYSVIAYPAT